MGLKEKLELLAEKQVTVPKMLETRADDLLTRFAALEKKDDTLFKPLSDKIAEHESGVSAVEHNIKVFEERLNLPMNGSGSQSGASTDKR